jgi:soluble lytic murein transglycosylase-like protein
MSPAPTTPAPNRRRTDLPRTLDDAAGTVDRRRRPRFRTWGPGESVVRRLRQPIIGLTLAGAALPMAAAVQQQRLDGEPGTEPAEDAGLSAGATAEAADLEDRLAEQVAEQQAVDEREIAIADAMERHGIARDLAEAIHDIAAEEDIEPRLAFGLVNTESTFRERAVSHVGARGLTQVMPRTAAWMVPGTTANDLFDRETNLRLGFRYLNQMIDKYKGNVRLALLAYNRGPGTVDRVLKQGGNPDNGYADKVLRG